MGKKQIINQGTLLLAEPFIMDVYFRRAAILICDKHDEGTLGFILNKPLDVKVQDILSDFPEFDGLAYYGGPVQTDSLHFLHSAGDLVDDSQFVCQGVYWGGDFEKVKILIKNGLLKPEQIRFYVGYTGWSKDQLEEEIKENTWIIDEMDPNYLFLFKSEKLWQIILEHKGNNHAVIAQISDFLNLN